MGLWLFLLLSVGWSSSPRLHLTQIAAVTIAVIITLLVSIAITLGGIAVTTLTSSTFKWLGDKISGSDHAKNIPDSDNSVVDPPLPTDNAVGDPYPAIELPNLSRPTAAHIHVARHFEDRSMSPPLPEGITLSRLRRVRSIHFPPSRADRSQTDRRASAALDTALEEGRLGLHAPHASTLATLDPARSRPNHQSARRSRRLAAMAQRHF